MAACELELDARRGSVEPTGADGWPIAMTGSGTLHSPHALGPAARSPACTLPAALTCVHDTMGRLFPAWRAASHFTWYSSPVAIWWYT